MPNVANLRIGDSVYAWPAPLTTQDRTTTLWSGCLGVAAPPQAVARRRQRQTRLTLTSTGLGSGILLLLLTVTATTATATATTITVVTQPTTAQDASESTTQHAELSRGAARGDHGAYNATNSIPAYNSSSNNSNSSSSSTTSASSSNSNTTATDAAEDAEQMLPQIPSYIRTTAMFFCIIIMLLGVVGNVMVSPSNFDYIPRINYRCSISVCNKYQTKRKTWKWSIDPWVTDATRYAINTKFTFVIELKYYLAN